VLEEAVVTLERWESLSVSVAPVIAGHEARAFVIVTRPARWLYDVVTVHTTTPFEI